jgi:glycosyltransferase involved in cell wall biosynthesis
MKIAIWHNLPSGGGLRTLDDQLRGLAARGHELHGWSPPSAGRCASDGDVPWHEVPLSVPPRGNASHRLRSAWRGRRQDLEAFVEHSARCADEITSIGPDVVLAHSCQYFRVPAVGAYLDVPSAVYLHEPNRRLYEATSGSPWAASAEARTLGPGAVRHFIGELVEVELHRVQVRSETAWAEAFDEVLVNSLFSRESVLRAYGRDSRVCRLGIDSGRFTPQDRPEELRGSVLTVGALVGEKNAEFLIRALATAGDAVQRFTWVANHVDDPYRQVVTRLAERLGVPLDLRPAVSDGELLQHLADADVFVYAPRLEPFGLAPLEANATGLPVVAVAEAGVRETISHGVNGLLVEPDEAAFGHAVAGLLADSARARALGATARAHVTTHWPLDGAIDRLETRLLALASGTERVPA